MLLQDLRVWCESSQAPPTHGFGQQASGMLVAYQHLRAVMESMSVIRQMHAALMASAPPLQAYQPAQLLTITTQGQAELARLSKELEVLRAASQRLAASRAASS